MCRDESLQILANPHHDGGVPFHPRHQHPAFQRRDDEPRQPWRVHAIPELSAQLFQQGLELAAPLVEDAVEPLAKSLVRIGQLAGQVAEGRAIPCVALVLQRHERVDEQRQPVERLNHRLAKQREPPFGEARELPLEHFVPQLLLGLEVVVEMALPTQTGRTDQVFDRGVGKPPFVDQPGGGVENSCSAWSHPGN